MNDLVTFTVLKRTDAKSNIDFLVRLPKKFVDVKVRLAQFANTTIQIVV